MSINPIYYSEDIKKIDKIEFSIYCNKDVIQYSAVSDDPLGIVLAESYENYEPKKGGLVDLRLGTCDIYLPCSTCGEDSLNCPGHFGHTELAEPVFHYGFMNHLKNILQCICLECSQILVNKNESHIKKIINKKPEFRYKEIKNLTKTVTSCLNCGVPVPKIKKEVKDNGTIRITIEKNATYVANDQTSKNVKTSEDITIAKKLKEFLTPRECFNILRNITEDDCFLLGFNYNVQKPEDLIIETFPIPPVIIRPTARE
jgi:DNA-directed RNA polymerase II subunit RPB1